MKRRNINLSGDVEEDVRMVGFVRETPPVCQVLASRIEPTVRRG
jgi:hypothetical protein